MNVGFDHPLYILPLDHRGTSLTEALGWKGELTAEQSAHLTALKWVVYDGFRAALADGVPAAKAALLGDEPFAAAILRDAALRGHTTALAVEWADGDEFDLEYGSDYTTHIEAFRPTFCKALVRYNPEGDAATNARQVARLKRLCDYLHRHRPPSSGGPLFMLALAVPPLPGQLDLVRGDGRAYDLEVRPSLVARSIDRLQRSGVEPDVWMVEGLERREDCQRVADAARQGGRDRVGCIVMGHGGDARSVSGWLETAATVTGFVGFAIGRTTFRDALNLWRAGLASRTEAVAAIAGRYREWVNRFEEARGAMPGPAGQSTPGTPQPAGPA